MRPVLAATSFSAIAVTLIAVLTGPADAATAPGRLGGDTSLPPGTTQTTASGVGFDPAAPVATPPKPAVVPEGIEAAANYLKQSSCDPVAKPGAVALGNLLRDTYPSTSYSIGRDCSADGIASEHYEGRAVDWFVSVRNPQDKAQADALIAWLTAPGANGETFANARRLGIMYLIWNNQIWGSYQPTWRPYSGCALTPSPTRDTTCHRDHVHISLSWAGAMKRTSYWTGKVAGPDYGPCIPDDLNWAPKYSGRRATPCPPHTTVTAPPGASPALRGVIRYSGAQLQPGSRGAAVRALQSGLAALGATILADGGFGPQTTSAVKAFQSSVGRRPSGIVDGGAWRKLISTLTASGSPTPGSTPKPPAPKPTDTSLAAYRNTQLRVGSHGPAVIALQKALRLTPDGSFGPLTRAAVIAFQRSKGLAADGVVGPSTWTALSA